MGEVGAGFRVILATVGSTKENLEEVEGAFEAHGYFIKYGMVVRTAP